MDIYVLADRIRKLASADPASLNRDKAGLITFTFGAIYALGQAQEHGGVRNFSAFVDLWEDRVRDVRELSGGMALKKRIPTMNEKNKLWVAGFHLNNALVRIDVGFERVCRYWAKIPVKKNLDREELESAAVAKNLPKSFLRPWARLRSRESNLLKHHVSTLFTCRRMQYRDVLECLETLVDAVEYCLKKRR
jgi:hypothetical protein